MSNQFTVIRQLVTMETLSNKELRKACLYFKFYNNEINVPLRILVVYSSYLKEIRFPIRKDNSS